MEIINTDQYVFLPLRYILENVLLTHEALVWACQSNLDMIFLKQMILWIENLFLELWQKLVFMMFSSKWLNSFL